MLQMPNASETTARSGTAPRRRLTGTPGTGSKGGHQTSGNSQTGAAVGSAQSDDQRAYGHGTRSHLERHGLGTGTAKPPARAVRAHGAPGGLGQGADNAAKRLMWSGGDQADLQSHSSTARLRSRHAAGFQRAGSGSGWMSGDGTGPVRVRARARQTERIGYVSFRRAVRSQSAQMLRVTSVKQVAANCSSESIVPAAGSCRSAFFAQPATFVYVPA